MAKGILCCKGVLGLMAVFYHAWLDITKQKNIFFNLSFQWKSKIANYCAADQGYTPKLS
jgi:hypothetical protein